MPVDREDLRRRLDPRMARYKIRNAEHAKYATTRTRAGTAPTTVLRCRKATRSLYGRLGRRSRTVLSPTLPRKALPAIPDPVPSSRTLPALDPRLSFERAGGRTVFRDDRVGRPGRSRVAGFLRVVRRTSAKRATGRRRVGRRGPLPRRPPPRKRGPFGSPAPCRFRCRMPWPSSLAAPVISKDGILYLCSGENTGPVPLLSAAPVRLKCSSYSKGCLRCARETIRRSAGDRETR